MDSNYLLQVDYHEHRTDHPDYRQSYTSSSFSSDDSQFWPYPYPTESSQQYPRYIPSHCDSQQDTGPPFIYTQGAPPGDEFDSPTRLGLFDISAIHAPIGSAEPWGPRNEGQYGHCYSVHLYDLTLSPPKSEL